MSEARRRGIAVIALAAIAAAPLAACDDDRQPEERAAAAVRELQRAFAARDLAAMCDRMTAGARRQAGLVAHGTPGSCRRDLREALTTIRLGGGWRGEAEVDAEAARVDGRRALVAVAGRDGRRTDVPLREVDGEWRLDSFLGTPPPLAERAAAAIEASSFPPAASGAVRAGDGERRCPPLASERFPEDVGGGCTLRVRGAELDVSIAAAFGDFAFGGCELDYRVSVDAAGRTWTSDVDFSSEESRGCSDIAQCNDEATSEPLAWKGRLRQGRGFTHVMSVCLNTCIGYYAGTLVVELSGRGRSWRAEAVAADVGSSGFRLDGPLSVRTKGLVLGTFDKKANHS